MGGLCALGVLGAGIHLFLIAAVGEKFAHLAQILKYRNYTKVKDRRLFFRGGFQTRLNHTLRELLVLRG